jgi:hypothetical protein
MQPIVPSLAALAVAAIFYTWRAWQQAQTRRERLLRERVAYMLWVMATNHRYEEEVVAVH